MGIDPIRGLIVSEKGDVALEFILMLPIYLLLLGGTMLVFELTMGIVHLQEANRNLAWVAGDRFFSDIGSAKNVLHTNITKYYTDRNERESMMNASEDYWVFGNSSDHWAVNVVNKKTGKGVFQANTEWSFLAAGNMELHMNHVSALFVGMIAASSDFYNSEDGREKNYAKSFTLTRTSVPDSSFSMEGDDFRPESYLYRRRSRDITRNGQSTDSVFSTIGESWPQHEDDGNSIQPSTGVVSGSGGNSAYSRVLSTWAQ